MFWCREKNSAENFRFKKKREEYFSKILNFISLDMLDCCEKINVKR